MIKPGTKVIAIKGRHPDVSPNMPSDYELVIGAVYTARHHGAEGWIVIEETGYGYTESMFITDLGGLSHVEKIIYGVG